MREHIFIKPVKIIIGNTIISIIFMFLINRAAQGFGGITGKILERKPLVYIIGKISYGIYLYHLFMPPILSRGFHYLGLHYPDLSLIRFILQTAATLIVAMLSWHFIEKPINNFKKHFEYST